MPRKKLKSSPKSRRTLDSEQSVYAMLAEKYGVGRPTKFNVETIAAILEAIKLGATNKLACEIAGVDVSTFSDWQARRPEFSAAITRARAEMLQTNLLLVRKGAHKSPHAAIWLLERMRPDEYGRYKLVLENPDGSPLQFTEVGAAAAELRSIPEARGRLHALLAELGGKAALSGIAALLAGGDEQQPATVGEPPTKAGRVPGGRSRRGNPAVDNPDARSARKE